MRTARRTGTAKRNRRRIEGKLKADAIPRDALAAELQKRIEQLGLSRNDAAVAVGDAASQMSRLMTGHVTDFSADRLVKMLTRLGSDVILTIRHRHTRRRAQGKVRVVSA